MKRSTREWVKKAEDDFQLAILIFSGSKPVHDHVAFHCEQAAEKYLKAILNELGRPFAKTHDLVYLLDQLLPDVPTLTGQRRSLRALTKYAVEVRYPGKHTRKREAEVCLRWAGRARATCREFLGLKVT
jgi:HEPN domain-containing protein